jgi:hypothetical protein
MKQGSNGFSHLVVIDLAITTKSENRLHNRWQLLHCHVPIK